MLNDELHWSIVWLSPKGGLAVGSSQFSVGSLQFSVGGWQFKPIRFSGGSEVINRPISDLRFPISNSVSSL
jgi:hypothetical protein